MICSKIQFKLNHWPILTFSWFVLTFIVSYVWALCNDHIYPLFPYISDTGALSPESCMFGQMMNIGAVMITVCHYTRYRQIRFLNDVENSTFVHKLNKCGLYVGAVGCLGISMVGNFQESQFLTLHLVGAVMVFCCGSLVLCIQTAITFKLRSAYIKYPEFGISNKVIYFRVFLTVWIHVLQTSTVVFSILAFLLYNNTAEMSFAKYLHWSEEDGGYYFRLVATFSEYGVVLAYLSYLLTMGREFKALEFKEIHFKSKYLNETANQENKIVL
ncbi:hypothetical protein PPYR_03830 [Photinus pyralis]|uniref:CWH43-like N-terminal domain-containing protein n=2 Tax=Photinus pyralis TaxID=7054 RepID=A0A5N4AWD5_PHOPY|nr:DNA damage-regulated autophagy modulator protein 2-like [Photinus pyralis]KAB0801644.1 hypothetical protein PPYR_03830 [Photinus pyralis]